jgi:hypothetical protein
MSAQSNLKLLGSAVLALGIATVSLWSENASANVVFDFSFGPNAFGTFTTGAAAADPGYDLITGLTFDVLMGVDTNAHPFSFTNQVGSGFQPGAAFNPTTDAFINHAAGSTFNDIGNFGTPDVTILGGSFAQSSVFVFGFLNGVNRTFEIPGPLVITAATVVPEPSTWAMMALGFGLLGLVGYRKTRSDNALA